MPEQSSDRLNPWTEGDARTQTHAKGCGRGRPGCAMYCRCWCHGITKHQNGTIRADAEDRCK